MPRFLTVYEDFVLGVKPQIILHEDAQSVASYAWGLDLTRLRVYLLYRILKAESIHDIGELGILLEREAIEDAQADPVEAVPSVEG